MLAGTVHAGPAGGRATDRLPDQVPARHPGCTRRSAAAAPRHPVDAAVREGTEMSALCRLQPDRYALRTQSSVGAGEQQLRIKLPAAERPCERSMLFRRLDLGCGRMLEFELPVGTDADRSQQFLLPQQPSL